MNKIQKLGNFNTIQETEDAAIKAGFIITKEIINHNSGIIEPVISTMDITWAIRFNGVDSYRWVPIR